MAKEDENCSYEVVKKSNTAERVTERNKVFQLQHAESTHDKKTSKKSEMTDQTFEMISETFLADMLARVVSRIDL